MNATEAKALLEPIPADKFITGKFSDDVGKCCGVGHLVRLKSSNPNDYSGSNCCDYYHKDKSVLQVKTFTRKEPFPSL